MSTSVVSGSVASAVEQKTSADYSAEALRIQAVLDRQEVNPVQTHELVALRDRNIICAHIAEAGYPEVKFLPKGWEIGRISDPRPYKWLPISLGKRAMDILLCGFIGMVISLMCFLVARTMVSTYSLLFTILGCLGGALILGLQQSNERALMTKGFSRQKVTYNFLKTLPPTWVMEKVGEAKASRLFDTIEVWAPRQAFRRAFQGDPMIIGRKGETTWLIAAYD